jgi:hypothetical protein
MYFTISINGKGVLAAGGDSKEPDLEYNEKKS